MTDSYQKTGLPSVDAGGNELSQYDIQYLAH